MAAAAPWIIMAAGTAMSMMAQNKAAKSAEQQAMAQQQAANYTADRMDERAGAERAASQRTAMNERRREKIVQSNLQARSAASGAGALDPTVVNLSEDIAAEGDYRARTALYEGEEKARGLENSAALRRFEGAQLVEGAGDRADAMRLGALGGGLSSAGSLYAKYGGGGMGGGGAGVGVNTTPYYNQSFSPTYGPYGQNGMRPY